MAKNPFDLSLYSMLLDEVQPQTIIEIGSYRGGSALWFADRCPQAQVISIDVEAVGDLDHPRIRFLAGDADDLSAVLPSAFLETIARPLLVIEDSSHQSGTVRAVLEFFDPWMRPGEYLVVEDGNVIAMGVADDFDGGPLVGIRAFLASAGDRWEIDRRYCDHFGHNVTWNVDGYLRRTSAA